MATLVTFVGCESVAPSPSAPPSLPSTIEAPTQASTPVDATPMATPGPTDQSLADPGGTCTAAQLVPGEATLTGEPGAVMTQHVLVFEEVRNSGGACVLGQPMEIGLATASGPFVAYKAPSLGQLVYVGNAGHYEYPASYSVRAGQSFQIDINAYWWFTYSGSPTRPPEYPCGPALTEIVRAEIPLALGVLDMAWNPPFAEVCTAPPSVSIGFEFK